MEQRILQYRKQIDEWLTEMEQNVQTLSQHGEYSTQAVQRQTHTQKTDTEKTDIKKTDIKKTDTEEQTMQEMVQDAKDSVEGSGMSIEILAEGNTLIYEYTFEEDSLDDSMLDAVKEQLVSGLESAASTFEGIASDLNDELKVENSTVVVRYLYNGETLAESEYTAD